MTAPGVPTVTIREVQAASRQLVSAMARRKAARKALAKAEDGYAEARKRLRTLLEIAQNTTPPEPFPRCSECKEPLGLGMFCDSCHATNAFVKGGS